MPLVLAPAAPIAWGAIVKGAAYIGSAAAAAWGVNQAVEAISADDGAAQDLDEDTPVAVTCATCAQSPCAHLACGAPGSTYRGGAHGCVGRPAMKALPDGAIHSHHTPADHYSHLPTPVGPSVQLAASDHRNTSSYGRRVHGPRYAPQRQALASGRTMEAIFYDVADIRNVAREAGDPTRYDAAISQMLGYAECLHAHGIIR